MFEENVCKLNGWKSSEDVDDWMMSSCGPGRSFYTWTLEPNLMSQEQRRADKKAVHLERYIPKKSECMMKEVGW